MPRRPPVVSGYDRIFDTDEGRVEAFTELRERMEAFVGKQQHRRVPFLPWNAQLTTAAGEMLDFDTFPFQREWYEDEIVYTRFVAWMKATQVGVSEYGVRWALFFPDKHGDKALYIFPALRQLRDFSDERVKPLVRSEYLKRRVPRDSVDNKMLKTVGLGSIYFRGSKNATDLDSIPAGVLAMDEYDDLVQGNIPRAEKRLSSPKSRGLIRRFGVPRYTDMGIHREYERSDKRQWFVRCRSCRTELPLHYYAQEGRTHHFVDVEREAIICANCETPIKREWIAKGRWVAEHPDREYVGYHVSRLIVPSARVHEIVEEAKRTKPFEVQEFWNSTLGLPYDPAEGRLSKQAIQAATRNYYIGDWDAGYGGDNLVTAGVDIASVRNLNVRISEHINEFEKRALFIGEVDSFDKLTVMMDSYKIHLMMIDHQPDGRLGTAMVVRFPGRCFTVSWGDKQGDVLKIETVEGGVATGKVSARRTESISATLDMIRTQKNHLPENLPEDYVKHMRAAVLKREEDEKGRVVVYYHTPEDHDYLQAESYDLIATETWWALYLKGQAQRETFKPLDDMIPFRRTDVNVYGAAEYSPGITSDQETWGREVAELQGEDDPGEFGQYKDW